MVRPEGVAVAVIRVRCPPAGEDGPRARMMACRDVLDPSWTLVTFSDPAQVLTELSEWLAEIWGIPGKA
jgi:hypothetical protein